MPAEAGPPEASDPSGPSDELPDGQPAGDVYDWYRRGLSLLDDGNAAAAATLLSRARDAAPEVRSVREALGRALYDSGAYRDAIDVFAELSAEDPADDYARFGWGRAALAAGDAQQAVEQLALAAAMRPSHSSYAAALRSARHALGIAS